MVSDLKKQREEISAWGELHVWQHESLGIAMSKQENVRKNLDAEFCRSEVLNHMCDDAGVEREREEVAFENKNINNLSISLLCSLSTQSNDPYSNGTPASDDLKCESMNVFDPHQVSRPCKDASIFLTNRIYPDDL